MGEIQQFVRFETKRGRRGWGILKKGTIWPITAAPYLKYRKAGAVCKVSQVKLLAPAEPRKILCVGQNYKSHLAGRPVPKRPEMFLKPLTALQNPGDPVVLPANSTDVHFESEMVLTIGRTVKNAPLEEAGAAIFGVSCGNDISERAWQHGADKDLQWWRAKGCDTFAPLGPALVTGLNPDNLLLEGKLNGETVQKQFTSDLIFDCATIVRHVSQHMTLEPGDIIYTGTPGATMRLKHGDVFEVHLEGVGVLTNPIQNG
jgi:2-keto-4-pentenoate hydratase/2-oxohepta-3-ene-1,7-dioic acid hydratase in catechol pathway